MKAKNPHRADRYGELWPQGRIDAALTELEKVRPLVVLSGGWAWHFMSPVGHVEKKHAHDHKDADIFVNLKDVAAAVTLLYAGGFSHVWTRYDRLESPEEFRRYEKLVDLDGKSSRITIDFFLGTPPERLVQGWRVVEPTHLLGLYRTIHSSSSCFAAVAAQDLISRGLDPIGREELLIPSAGALAV